MNQQLRVLSQTAKNGEEEVELTLRPRAMNDFIGQDNLKESLNISISAAKLRAEPIDHILLYGPPGLGKTTLAHIIAHEMGGFLYATSGPAILRAGDLAAILTNLQQGGILFIDEIHRLNKVIEEILYPAMEDFALDLVVGKGPSARTLKIDLPRFTLVGATTRISLLSSPLRDRFGIMHHLSFYEEHHIKEIIHRSSRILKIEIEKDAAEALSKRSRRTPRVANRLLKRVRDYSEVEGHALISKQTAEAALKLMAVDNYGLDDTDRQILEIIIKKFNGGPVGLNTLAAALFEEEDTIAEIYEPFLMQIGFLLRTSRGRVATEHAYRHLGVVKQGSLL